MGLLVGVPQGWSVSCGWCGSFWFALGVWDEGWLSLGFMEAMAVVTDGVALEGVWGFCVYSAVLV